MKKKEATTWGDLFGDNCFGSNTFSLKLSHLEIFTELVKGGKNIRRVHDGALRGRGVVGSHLCQDSVALGMLMSSTLSWVKLDSTILLFEFGSKWGDLSKNSSPNQSHLLSSLRVQR